MSRLDRFLEYAESHRGAVYAVAAGITALIAILDWLLVDLSIGFLYLVPILFVAPAMNNAQISAFAFLCGFLTEAFDPARNTAGSMSQRLFHAMDPFQWGPGSSGRLVVAVAAFAMTGF